LRRSLVDPKKTLLPPLYIKLGIMKQFVKALPNTGNYFKYLCKTFPHLSEAKLKQAFSLALIQDSLQSVATKFLGNNKDPDYITIVANMLEKFKVLG
jgi:hypothetical protein